MELKAIILALINIFAILPICVSSFFFGSSDKTINNSFNRKLFNELYISNEDINIVVSPFSIETCLTMTRMGADGQTAKEMDQVLRVTGETPESMGNKFKAMLTKYEESNDLKMINKLYISQDYQLQESYKNVLSSKFLSAPEFLDFSQPEKAVEFINAEIEMQSNQTIKDIISLKDLATNTRFLLLSAVNFKGEFALPIPSEDTRERPFYIDENNSVNIEMMKYTGMFEFALLTKELISSAVRLPYKDSNLSLLIILPGAGMRMRKFQRNLKEKNFDLRSLKDKFTDTEGILYLPKFKTEFKIELANTLKKMGMKKIFSGADLGAMLQSPESLDVSKVLHKASIEVTESVIEAIPFKLDSKWGALKMLPRTFAADRPFYYAIINEDFEALIEGTFVGLQETTSGFKYFN